MNDDSELTLIDRVCGFPTATKKKRKKSLASYSRHIRYAHTNRAASHTAAEVFMVSVSTPVTFASITAADQRIMASQLFW